MVPDMRLPTRLATRHDPVRERRPDTRPLEIMGAALELFVTKGLRATTLDQVAEAAGVTKGGIYHYFKGKEDLLRSAVQRRLAELVSHQRELDEHQGGLAATRLRVLVRHVWATWRQPEAAKIFRFLMGEMLAEHPDLIARWARELAQPLFSSIGSILRDGAAAGEFRRDLDIPVLSEYLLLSTLDLAVMQSAVESYPIMPGFPQERVIDVLVDVLFQGLRAPSGAGA